MRRIGVALVGGVVAIAGVHLALPTGAEASRRGPVEPLVELGRRLFFDPAISQSGHNACASCHDPEVAFSSPARFDEDDFALTRRHSQTLVDVALGKRFHWDGEFDSVEHLVTARLGGIGTRPLQVRAKRASLLAAAEALGTGASGAGRVASGGTSYGPPPSSPPPTGGGDVPPPSTSGDAADRDSASTTPGSSPEAGASGEGTSTDDSTDGSTASSDAASDASLGNAAAEGSSSAAAAGDPADASAPSGSDEPAARDAGHVEPISAAADMDGASARSRTDRRHATSQGPVANRIEQEGRYADAFYAVFGSREVSTARLARAIAAYVATIRSGVSDYDRHVAREKDALSPAAIRGLALFRGRAGCAQCHVMEGPRAAFTDHDFHNTGVAARAASRRGAPVVTGTTRVVAAPVAGSAPTFDRGRAALSGAGRDVGAFKTPTLRDVAVRAPYMHDGGFRTLEAVVRHYARGGHPDPRLDARIRPFSASDGDVADLVAFLRALTSDVPAAIAPEWDARAASTTLRILDSKGRPVSGIALTLEPAGDRLPGDGVRLSRTVEVVTNAKGVATFALPRRTHVRLVAPPGVTVRGGAWIPDTSREVTVEVGTVGRTSLLLAFPADEPSLPTLRAYAEARAFTPAERERLRAHAPGALRAVRRDVATFVCVGRVEVGGRAWVRYDAWVPTGAPASAVVDVPLPDRVAAVDVALAPDRETRRELVASERGLGHPDRPR